MALKELIVVLVFSIVVFHAARPVCIRLITAETYDRRRRVWLLLTIAAFISPSFWLYVVIAAGLIAWLSQKDNNPQALLMFLLFLIPPMVVQVPFFGINYLFELTQLRLLSLVLIIPWILKYLHISRSGGGTRWGHENTLLAALVSLQIFPLLPYEDFTNSFRRSFHLILDSSLVLYFMSRLSATRDKLVDVILMLCVVSSILGLLAVVETIRTWNLYGGFDERWGVWGGAWVLRGGQLRALVSTGHPLTLGYVLAIGFCFWLWFRPVVTGWVVWFGVAVVLWAGLIAANSRGPWLTAGLAFILVYFMTADSIRVGISRAALMVGLVVLVLVSPMGDDIVAKLPFIGDDPEGNVAYRQRLAEISWNLAWSNPWFGDPFVLRHMEELRQGEGIIDLVNAFAAIALFHGFVGLALYVGIFLLALYSGYKRIIEYRSVNAEMERLGVVLFAAVVATMFMMATGGFAILQYSLAGLLIAYGSAPIYGQRVR